MRLIKCKKCGTPIASRDLMMQRLLDGMSEANNNAKNARKYSEKTLYIQQASQYKQLIKSITHATTQIEDRKTYLSAELKAIVKYLVDNELMTYEEIGVIQNNAREQVKKSIEEDKKKLNKLYQDAYNELFNNSKSDITSKTAMRNVR